MPLLVAVICSLFLFPKTREHRSLRQENEKLAASIGRHRDGSSGNRTPGKGGNGATSPGQRDERVSSAGGLGGELLDMSDEELVKFFLDLDNTLPNFRNELAFEEFVESASEGDLVAMIERMMMLELSNSIRDRMLDSPFRKLAELNPEKALTLAFEIPNYDHDLNRRRTAEAFSNWLKSAPEEAMAWFDNMESVGGLDAKTLRQSSDIRLGFEQVILSSFLKENYQEARARLMSLPEDLRRDVILFDYSSAQFAEVLQKGGLGNLGQLIREFTPPSDHAKNLSSLATMLTWMPVDAGESFEKLAAGMGASPEESAEMAKALASQIMFSRTVSFSPPDANAFPSSRELLSQYAPGQEGQVVGRALSDIAAVDEWLHEHG